MNKKIKTDAVEHLFDAIMCLKTKEECYSFFEDLCTVNELLSLSQRFEVAAMLRQHRNDFSQITGKRGVMLKRFLYLNQYRNLFYVQIFHYKYQIMILFTVLLPSLLASHCPEHRCFAVSDYPLPSSVPDLP